MTDEAQQNSTKNLEQQDLKDEFLKAVRDLPPMPKVLFKIQQLLLDPNSDARQIVEYIETDQALAAKVLKIANSSFYGMMGKVSSVQHAAVILGFKTLGEVTTLAGFSEFMGKKLPGYGYDSDELWKHSLAVALASRMIAEKIDPQLSKEALTAGLIHDRSRIRNLNIRVNYLRQYIFRKTQSLCQHGFVNIKYFILNFVVFFNMRGSLGIHNPAV